MKPPLDFLFDHQFVFGPSHDRHQAAHEVITGRSDSACRDIDDRPRSGLIPQSAYWWQRDRSGNTLGYSQLFPRQG